MKAAGYNPKADFFLSLAAFNQAVASQDLLAITNTKLKDRLTGAKPLLLENGQPYGGAEFWSLYAGLIQPPALADRPSRVERTTLSTSPSAQLVV